MDDVELVEYRPGRFAKVKNGRFLGKATPEEVAAWLKAQEQKKARAAGQEETKIEQHQVKPEAVESADGGDDALTLKRGGRPVCYVYGRPGAYSEPERLLGKALSDFMKRFGELPELIICHPSWVEAVKVALNGRNITIQGLGGCLVGEIWLGKGE